MTKSVLSSALLLALFTACSKTPLEVENRKLSAQELAQRYADRLSSSDPSDAQVAREELKSFDATSLDWAHFWQLLKAKERVPVLQTDFLRHLSAIDCRDSAFGAFLNFLSTSQVEVSGFLRQLPCAMPPDAGVAVALLSRAETEKAQDFSALVIRTLEALSKTAARLSRTQMEKALRIESWQLVLQESLRSFEATQSYIASLKALQTSSLPYSKALIRDQISRLTQPANAWDLAPLHSWVLLMSYTETLLEEYTRDEIDIFWSKLLGAFESQWQSLASDAKCQEACLRESLRVLAPVRELLLRFPKNISMRLRLKWSEDFQRGYEKLLAQKESLVAKVLFEDVSVDSAWFQMRVLKPFATQVSARSTIKSTWFQGFEKINPLEQLLSLRVLIHSAEKLEEKGEWTSKFCKMLESLGVDEQRILISDLASKPLLPGCYSVEKDADWIEVKSFVQPFDSVLKIESEKLEIKAEHLDLAVLDLSRRQGPAALAQEFPEEEDHALVFPLLAGLRLKGPVKAEDQIIFFPIHTVVREARSEIAAKAQPQSGYRGGMLSITIPSAEALRFAPIFFSEGSSGQANSSPVAGGNGDQSFLSLPRVDRAMLDMSGPDMEAITFMPKLSVNELYDIWTKASNSGNLPELQILTMQNLDMLPEEEKKKALRFCELRGLAAEIDSCFDRYFVPLMEEVVRKHIDGHQFLTEAERSNVPAELNGEKIFYLPSGKVGPQNKNGHSGERGEISVSIVNN
jgi:hypothetical protein